MEAKLLSADVSNRKAEMGLSERKQNLEEKDMEQEERQNGGREREAYC